MDFKQNNLIQVSKLITDKELRTLFYESYVDNGCKHDFEYLNNFAPNRCPCCGKFNYVINGKGPRNLNNYYCMECNNWFNLLTNTAFEGISRPLYAYNQFLVDLFKKNYLAQDKIDEENSFRYSNFFKDLGKILFKASNHNKPFNSNKIYIHLFSYPNEVRDLTRLRNSDDLPNLIIAILTDGKKVKLRIVGTGFINRRFLLAKFSKIINTSSTIVVEDYDVFDELAAMKKLDQLVIKGTKEELKNSCLSYAISLEEHFRRFINYYSSSKVNLFTDIFISVFELVERKGTTIEDKISFTIALFLNSYKIKDKELFRCHREKFEQDLTLNLR